VKSVASVYVTESELTKSTKWTVVLSGRLKGGWGGRRMYVGGFCVFALFRFGGVASYYKLIRMKHFGFESVTRHRGFERGM
jgi:hypothetical protein